MSLRATTFTIANLDDRIIEKMFGTAIAILENKKFAKK